MKGGFTKFLKGVILKVLGKELEENILGLSETDIEKISKKLKKILNLKNRNKTVRTVKGIIKALISDNIHILYSLQKTEYKRLGISTIYNTIRKREVLTYKKEIIKEKIFIGRVLFKTYLECFVNESDKSLLESKEFIYDAVNLLYQTIEDFLWKNIPWIRLGSPKTKEAEKKETALQEVLDETEKLLDFYLFLNNGIKNRFYLSSKNLTDYIKSLQHKAEMQKLQKLQKIQQQEIQKIYKIQKRFLRKPHQT